MTEVPQVRLAPIQKRLLLFLDAYIRREGVSPTQQEMADYLGLLTSPGALYHLRKLEQFGFIKRGAAHMRRNIMVVNLPEGVALRETPGVDDIQALAVMLRTVYEQPGRTWADVARAALGFRVERIAA